MKAILEIDMPESCFDCPMENGEYAVCVVTGEDLTEIDYLNRRGDKCPLRPKEGD